MSQQETNWGQIVGGAVEGGLSSWLDEPNDSSVSADEGAATGGGDNRVERRAVANSGSGGNTGNTGWSMPQGNSLLMLGGLALAGVLAFAVVAAD